ncbi:MAG: uracil-DNA glycosylase [Flavobacteriaceae bacterium]|nr:uracil-DNA glycosylase [Flavobacteriaceae bacterium]
MMIKIESSWKEQLNNEFSKPYFKELTAFIKQEYVENTCYPLESLIFSAFNHIPFNKVKVVIIGQDPYHGIGQANGLCFSVNDEIPHPPSLKNIFKELETDLLIPYPKNGNLERWAKQGILLLNATLTVRANEAASHQKKGWEQFTDAVISKLSDEREGIVFLLWGGFAKKKGAKINTKKHLVLTSGHPSPLSANRGYWFSNKHFSATNMYLKEMGKEEIGW